MLSINYTNPDFHFRKILQLFASGRFFEYLIFIAREAMKCFAHIMVTTVFMPLALARGAAVYSSMTYDPMRLRTPVFLSPESINPYEGRMGGHSMKVGVCIANRKQN